MGEWSGGEDGGVVSSVATKTFVCTAPRYAKPHALCHCLFLPDCHREKRQPSPYLFNGRVAFSPSCPTDGVSSRW